MIKHNSFGGYDSGYVSGYNKASKDMRTVIEDIKAEIDKLHKVGNGNDGKVYVPINDVFDVIDKHIVDVRGET